jgi:hypothetical protein
MVGRRGLATPTFTAGTFVPKGPFLHAGLSKNRLLQGSAGILPALAPAVVSRRGGKKTEDLKKQETREEVAESLAAQNMERDAPWTAWSKMHQPRG